MRGFTLIELLVVLTIIGVLATFATVNFLGTQSRARDAQRKADVQQIRSALEFYRSDTGSYPLPVAGAVRVCGAYFRYPDPGGVLYMQKMPCDPLTNNAYRYVSNGTTYSLISCLENVNDKQKDAANNATYCAGGSTNWSYTLTNP